MQKRWLFPKHSAFLSHCLENELRFLKLAFAFLFIRKCICKTSSKFLPFTIPGHRVIFFSDTVFNVYEPKDHSSSRAHDVVQAQLKPPLPHSPFQQQQLIIRSTLQRAVQAQKSIWLPVQLCKIIPGEKKEMSERKEKRGWEGGKEQERGHKPSQAHKDWSLMAECLFWTVTWGLAGH